MVNNTLKPLNLREGTPLLIGYEAGRAQSRSECFGEEKYIAAAGNRNQDCPSCSLDNSVHFLSIGVPFWLNITNAKYKDSTKNANRRGPQHSTQKQYYDKQETITKQCRRSTGTKAPYPGNVWSVDWYRMCLKEAIGFLKYVSVFASAGLRPKGIQRTEGICK